MGQVRSEFRWNLFKTSRIRHVRDLYLFQFGRRIFSLFCITPTCHLKSCISNLFKEFQDDMLTTPTWFSDNCSYSKSLDQSTHTGWTYRVMSNFPFITTIARSDSKNDTTPLYRSGVNIFSIWNKYQKVTIKLLISGMQTCSNLRWQIVRDHL